MEICVKKLFLYFLFFFVFNHDFMIYTDFTCIAASNTATYDIAN